MVEHLDPFEKTYPIIAEEMPGKGTVYHIYIHTEIGTPSDVQEIVHVLVTAGEDDEAYLYINSPGGQLDATLAICNALEYTQAATVAVLTGTVASAATMIALKCKALFCAANTEFMCHNYSGGIGGKGGEIASQYEFSKKRMPKLMHNMYRDFLTDDEIEQLRIDQDKYLDADEVMDRFENLVQARAAQAEQEAKAERDEQIEQLAEHIKLLQKELETLKA